MSHSFYTSKPLRTAVRILLPLILFQLAGGWNFIAFAAIFAASPHFAAILAGVVAMLCWWGITAIVPAWDFTGGAELALLVGVITSGLFGERAAVGEASGAEGHDTGRWRTLCFAVAVVCVVAAVAFRTAPAVRLLAWSAIFAATGWRLPKSAPGPSDGNRRVAAVVNGALLVTSVVVAAAIVEVGARLLLPPAPEKVHFAMPHDEYIFTLRPGAFGTMFNADRNEEVPVRISSQGLRSAAVPATKSASEYRILMLGDSVTFGTGEPLEHTISARLEAWLQASGVDARVINAGVHGYGPWQERGFLRERGFPLNPDLVILQVLPANDVINSLTQVGKVTEAYFPPWERVLRSYRYRNDWRVRADEWLRDRSRAYGHWMDATGHAGVLLWLLNDLRVFPPAIDPARLRLPPTAQRPHVLEVCLAESYPVLEEGWALLERDIAAIRDDCAERGITFAAYALPGVFTLDDRRWEEILESVDPNAYVRGKGVARTHKIFDRHGIDYVDMVEALGNADDIPSLFHSYDGHLSPKGAETVAAALGKYILEGKLDDLKSRVGADDPS